MQPKLLDLYCCGGGGAVGYRQAGFDITGIDIKPQPLYPYRFHQADALEYLSQHGHKYDAVHASPPCQLYSTVTGWQGEWDDWPDLAEDTQDALDALGKPYVIENVPGAPLRGNVVTLCGVMFRLGVFRHRKFATNFELPQPDHIPHPGYIGDGRYVTVTGHCALEPAQKAMGIKWLDRAAIVEAIPPAYTSWVGQWLRASL